MRSPVSWSPASGRWMAVVVALVAAILTFGFVQQMKVERLLTETQQVREGQALSYLVEQDTVANTMLEARLRTLSARLRAVNPGNANPGNLNQALTLAGLIPVSGPGVEVTLADSPAPTFPGEPAQMQLVHDQYVLHIVGLLMANGATAIAISGQRFVSSTAVFCAGPTIRVNGVTQGSPFIISAVGRPASMLNALKQDPEVQGWSYLVQIHYRQSETVSVPAFSAQSVFRYATPDPRAS